MKENYDGTTVIGYHGSEGNTGFDRKNDTGIWFVLDPDSDIIEYYSNRSGSKKIIKARLNLGRCLDLSMYNTDYLCGLEEAESFLRDMELSESEIARVIDFTYMQATDSEHWDDNDIAILPLSGTLNHVIREYLIPQKKFDSLVIQEGQEHDTICMLNRDHIEIIE